jgi:anti-anti-sigma regulatory factor
MIRHLTLATSNQPVREQAVSNGAADTGATLAAAVAGRTGPVYGRTPLRLADERAWRHTLILTGTLDWRSAPELEEEIECLCEEGVASLTLDLRLLGAIDGAGARVIAFRSALCRRRGHGFAVIPGSHAVADALVEAGAGGALQERPPSPVLLDGPLPAGSVATTMVRDM